MLVSTRELRAKLLARDTLDAHRLDLLVRKLLFTFARNENALFDSVQSREDNVVLYARLERDRFFVPIFRDISHTMPDCRDWAGDPAPRFYMDNLPSRHFVNAEHHFVHPAVCQTADSKNLPRVQLAVKILDISVHRCDVVRL